MTTYIFRAGSVGSDAWGYYFVDRGDIPLEERRRFFSTLKQRGQGPIKDISPDFYVIKLDGKFVLMKSSIHDPDDEEKTLRHGEVIGVENDAEMADARLYVKARREVAWTERKFGEDRIVDFTGYCPFRTTLSPLNETRAA